MKGKFVRGDKYEGADEIDRRKFWTHGVPRLWQPPLRKRGACEGYINIKRLAHDRKWGKRFGDWLVKSVIKSLADMGEIQPKVVEGEKSETMYKLRTKW